MGVRVRFAPSPTGEIHIGNIRTAIINWLYVRRNGGTFVLRIEDTDFTRSEKRFESIIIQEMDWLGLTIDEGLGFGGGFGPYRQSERLDLYRKYADILLEKNMAFPCFCTPEEIEAHRDKARAEGKNLHYSGKCRHLTEETIERYRQEGRPEGLRFRNPGSGEIQFNDLIRGKVSFQIDLMDDFILLKSDASPSYNFACVVDDHLMEISHVLRGEDHISNTPKQLLLYEAFSWQPPQFGHLSLILDKTGQKFKKRSEEEEVFIGRYRDKGYLQEALFNYIALLGWSPENGGEQFSLAEAVEMFNLARVNPSPAIFDIDKLNWMNSLYIRALPLEELVKRAQPFLLKEAINLKGQALEYLVGAFQERAITLQELAQEAKKFLAPLTIEEDDLLSLKDPEIEKVLTWFLEQLKEKEELDPKAASELIKASMKELAVKGKMVYRPIRLALTGKGSGPEINEVMAFLGTAECSRRLGKIISLIKGDGGQDD